MVETKGSDGKGEPVGATSVSGTVETGLRLYDKVMGWHPETGVPRPAQLYELDAGCEADIVQT
jgi:hypothetical protein